MPRIEASTRQIAVQGIRSLVWQSEQLVDWAAGNRRIALDGQVTSCSVIYAYRFDAACASPSGRYVVLYERLGTKGLVLDQGRLIREINRSYYFANAFEYPVTIAALDNGQEVLIHCPDEYNQLEIDDLVTGQRLTASAARKSSDFFHSRLAVCGRFLMSAGWLWHPLEYVYVYDWHAALSDPRLLDEARELTPIAVEMEAAAFIDDQHLVVATTAESFADEEGKEFSLPNMQAPNSLGIWDLYDWQLLRQVHVAEPLGTIMPLGGSTAGHKGFGMALMIEALKRFAVATEAGVTVVQFHLHLD